jgi:hypothetical protein
MSLIINTPVRVPAQHWVEGKGGKLEIRPERRPASYEVFDARNNTKRTEVLDLVNTIRARVDAWRGTAGRASPSSRASCWSTGTTAMRGSTRSTSASSRRSRR